MGDVIDLNARRAKRTEPLLNKRQAAEHLGMSTRWVEQQQREHGLPFRRCGGVCLYYASELNEWVEARHAESMRDGNDMPRGA